MPAEQSKNEWHQPYHFPGTIISMPEPSGWECHLFGSGACGIVWRPAKGEVPNAFWRWMQFVCFGNRWRDTKKEPSDA